LIRREAKAGCRGKKRGAGKGTQYLSPLSTKQPGARLVRYALARFRIDSPFISMRCAL
jgi:hypothetical protein